MLDSANIVAFVPTKNPMKARQFYEKTLGLKFIADAETDRHSGDIAAVRGAHPRHGGAGALYIVLRRRRDPDTKS